MYVICNGPIGKLDNSGCGGFRAVQSLHLGYNASPSPFAIRVT